MKCLLLMFFKLLDDPRTCAKVSPTLYPVLFLFPMKVSIH